MPWRWPGTSLQTLKLKHMSREVAEDALRAGDPQAALSALTTAIRGQPGEVRLRIFLAQLLCVLGHWERAWDQLGVCAELDAAALPMREAYRQAIGCERLRGAVFEGRKSPLLFGEPSPWLALLIEALIRSAHGDTGAARSLRESAFEQAPATPGRIDDQPFQWLADADTRLGPILEAFVEGRYYWIPYERLTSVVTEAPVDLRDAVWLPAQLRFVNGGETPALLPVRYPGSEASGDAQLQLSRATHWQEMPDGAWCGLGQRQLTTESGEFALLDLRRIEFEGI